MQFHDFNDFRLHELYIYFLLPKTKGVSQGGNQLGLEDDRTGLVSEVFTTADNCPALHLVLQNCCMFIVFMLSFDVLPSVEWLLLIFLAAM